MQGQASANNQRIKALRQGRHWVWGLTHRYAIKDETIATNRDWHYNHACRLSHDIRVVSYPFTTFNNLKKPEQKFTRVYRGNNLRHSMGVANTKYGSIFDLQGKFFPS